MAKSGDASPPQPNPQQRLWELVDREFRGTGRYRLNEVLQAAQDNGINVAWEDLRRIASLWRGGPVITPNFVTDFVSDYSAELKAKTALDPWASIGSTLIPVVKNCNILEATGIIVSDEELAVAKLMSDDLPVKWISGQPRSALSSLGSFDLIVSSPPFGLQSQTVYSVREKAIFEIRDSETSLVVLESAQHLSADGVGIFLLPNSFFRLSKNGVRTSLAKFGLFVNAVIGLPAGVFSPVTAIPSNIVFISRTQKLKLFVGQLAEGTDYQQLLQNLRKHVPGASAELGLLVEDSDFISWQQIAATAEEERLVKRSGLTAVRLMDAVLTVNLAKRTDDAFENIPNAVYLPLIGTSPAVASLSNLRIKPHNYAQLVVRSDIADAEFLAGFFNSPLGRKVRESMLAGNFIPKLSKQTISEGRVYVLPSRAQQEVTAVAREIQDLRLSLEALERELWNRPVAAPAVRKAVTAINRKDGFESWVETLPFPLASVFWRYHAAGSEEHKVTHLLNAFEATTQFLGTLMASAFHSDAAFFRGHLHEWFEVGKDNPHSLARSSFGEWVVRCQRLAKTTRQMLSDKTQRDLVLGLYRADVDKVEGIVQKEIYQVMESVGRYRNDWKGHTGIVSLQEHERRLALLQDEVARLRGFLGGIFEDWWLIRPGLSSYTRGVHHYAVEKLVGSRQIFKQATVETRDVMDSTELYCYDVVTERPLQLLHFVRMLAVPGAEKVACFFYNRIEKEGIRWVSYHFESEAERVEPDSAVIKIIDEIEMSEGQQRGQGSQLT